MHYSGVIQRTRVEEMVLCIGWILFTESFTFESVFVDSDLMTAQFGVRVLTSAGMQV